jgi:phage baseplate assembly protein W
MAFGAQKIFPIDTKPGTAVGVALPFNAPGVFYSTYTTQNAIKNNLIDFFLTEPGERYLNPIFGGGLRSFIFNQMTDGNTEYLKADVQSKISTYFPSVIVQSLDVLQDPDYNTINVIIKYIIADTAISDEIQIAFN